MDIKLIPFKNKSFIDKFHIVNSNNNIYKFNVCNVYAPFGLQTEHKTKVKISQHRLNICFSVDNIQNNDKSYLKLKKIIDDLESFFNDVNELKNYDLVSNIINRDKHGIVIRFHLKTFKNKTITIFKHVIDTYEKIVSCIDFDKNQKLNFDFIPDSLWIDHENKKYGVSLLITDILQYIK
jgi:hypothetical protein